MRLRQTVGAAFLLLGSPFSASMLHAQDTPIDTMGVGRQATEYFYDGNVDSLWAMLTPKFQEGLGSPDALLDRLDMLTERAGDEMELIEESIRMRKGRPQYWRVAEFDMAPEPLLIRWVISPDGKVSGQGMGLASQPPATDD
jgi:hypothetical protein